MALCTLTIRRAVQCLSHLVVAGSLSVCPYVTALTHVEQRSPCSLYSHNKRGFECFLRAWQGPVDNPLRVRAAFFAMLDSCGSAIGKRRFLCHAMHCTKRRAIVIYSTITCAPFMHGHCYMCKIQCLLCDSYSCTFLFFSTFIIPSPL